MNKQTIRGIVFLVALAASSVAFPMGSYFDKGSSGSTGGAGGSIQITAPKDGATIDGRARNDMVFDVHPSPSGNHLHFYIDNGKPDIVREWKGSYTLPALALGKHEICIKEATAGHVLTGLQKCITVTAK